MQTPVDNAGKELATFMPVPAYAGDKFLLAPGSFLG